ncbi:hypothetical protein BU23DRAFT_267872 [Bimuria novae-zelandiae CBS 107.79]|uniref:DUF7820 domain-containing protein n=1 Tax=Bimuria novae-zelandiae CBS 107.79 TaxID=1447943 RepID=A0A6A5UWK6_9PLEO|nr:hypothetical protein BU23DRAFT_267872 [Bimuria novae-zelandiae CBS 107.79]
MRFARRSPSNIPNPGLPSILTLFPTDDQRSWQAFVSDSADRQIEEGLEIVPIERSNTSCGKTVSPDTDEKEVLSATLTLEETHSKPLPPLPKAAWLLFAREKWCQLPVKQRMVILLGVQLGLLLTICLSLLSIRTHSMEREDSSEISAESTMDSSKGTAIPVGSFALNLDFPRQQSSACLADNRESASWLCPSQAVILVQIESQEIVPKKRLLSLQSMHGQDMKVYGERPFMVSELVLDQIRDSERSDHAEVYAFRALYDRTVLVEESALSFVGSSKQSGPSKATARFPPNERPWLCYFNNTSVEGVFDTYQFATTIGNSTNEANFNATAVPSSSFPFRTQITEQWLANGTRAYCEQQTLTGGRLRATGAPKYFLNTTDISTVFDTSVHKQTERQTYIPENACSCQWIAQ